MVERPANGAHCSSHHAHTFHGRCCLGCSALPPSLQAGAESGSIPARQPFGTFISEHLFHKFGLASLRDNYLYGMVACIGSHVNKSSRVRLFGTLCGVVDPSRYATRVCMTCVYLCLSVCVPVYVCVSVCVCVIRVPACLWPLGLCVSVGMPCASLQLTLAVCCCARLRVGTHRVCATSTSRW